MPFRDALLELGQYLAKSEAQMIDAIRAYHVADQDSHHEGQST